MSKNPMIMDGLPFSAVGVKTAVVSGSAVFLRLEWNRDFFFFLWVLIFLLLFYRLQL